jgi:hypothetical protein
MLSLLIALAATPPAAAAAPAADRSPPVAVDVAGMAPQLAVIRSDAAGRGWRITCEGNSGEERVIRIAFPAGTSRETVMAYFGPGMIGSTMSYYSLARPAPESCDRQEPGQGSGDPVRLLGFGPRAVIEPLVGVARSCGYAGAGIRVRRRGDRIPAAIAMHRDWLVIDAGEDAGRRYGPMICWVQMEYRAVAAAPRR